MSYREWAYSETKVIPAELVSKDYSEIDELVVRDGGGQHGQGTYRNSSAEQLNDWPVYPVVRIDDPHGSTDTPNAPVETYETGDGGFLYQIHQTYTDAPPPTLEEEKAAGAKQAEANSTDYLNGNFEHQSVQYESKSDDRSALAAFAAQAALTTGLFSTSWLTADKAVTDFANKSAFGDFYNDYYLHLETTRDDLATALVAIEAATTTQEIAAALDAMLDPLNTPPHVPIP